MREVKKKAFAKINLGLDVLGRRADGYHELRMVMQRIGLCDELTLEKREDPGITLQAESSFAQETVPSGEGNFAQEMVPSGEDNLAWQAAHLLMNACSVREGLSISLKKHIPAAAGLAGGSADAAAVFLGVNELFDLGLTKEQLMQLGVQIGADVPYCILGGTALAEGIGEKLTPLRAAPQAFVVLVKPPVSVSTGAVYTALDAVEVPKHPDIDAELHAIETQDLKGLAENIGNVLEYVTVSDFPEIGELIGRMKSLGAAGAGMSGSGPTVFGLFEDGEKAASAYEAFRKEGREAYLTAFVD